ncbi:gliding motility-associated C-terminal domain-containing protein [Chitinophagaceae bacterium MMS25-I14]
MRYTIFFLSVCLLFLTVIADAQSVAILNADNTPVRTKWCDVDTSYEITGTPAGGTFTGCGVVQQNGKWYFNPSLAATGITVFPTQCTLHYMVSGNTASQPMLVYKPVNPQLGADMDLCRRDTFHLTAQTLYAGSYTYLWLPATGLLSGAQKQVTGISDTTETYTVTVTDVTSGCSGTDTITVFNRQPRPVVQSSRDTVCAGIPVTLAIVNPEMKASYTWYNNGSDTGLSTAYTFAQAGVHDVLLVSKNGYCTDTLIIPVDVHDFHLTLTPDAISADRNAPLSLATAASVSYQVLSWSPAYLFQDQHAHSQNILADTSHQYTVIAQSGFGCKDTATVYVAANPVLFVPSAFSPNGDGRNDYFHFRNWGDPLMVQYFGVFDRWGNCVWQSYASDDRGWDGTCNGKPAEAGVYYYVLRAGTAFGPSVFQKGDVTLIR